MWNINEFAAISIRMASPERIREWSHGEVKKPETINYRTLKPELEGLFCERIFGSTKDWECYCGKFKSIRYRGVVCDRCQVEVTHSKVRRERMGHIDLVAPVSHIWYFKGIPSKMGILLGMSLKELDRVLYFQSYVVTNPGDTVMKKKSLLTEEMFQEAYARYGNKFKAGMGAEAVRELLAEIDLPQLRHDIRESLTLKQSKQDERQLIRQLSVVEAFLSSGNKPEWMILTALPVIPPELRPMVQLDGGRFATSDLNDLYRRVLNRNNRLRRLVDLKAPSIIVRNEKRMLQEAVDALLDNGRRGRAVKGANNNRVLKSLSDMLKGKQGRFRQNLLGKRVDYSGRSVIVVGPELKLSQCGLPKKMALELFKPFIMRVLVNRGMASNIKAAKKMVERGAPEVWEVIEDVIADHPVMLNRAPTLHRLGIQAFQPVLVEGKAIRVHPLVCVAFNADFDGDQMAVHVPLSAEAIVECKLLMMADRNILSPASGKPVITPTQDIVLGIYYLTKEMNSKVNLTRVFSDPEECLYALETNYIHLQGRIRVRIEETIEGKIRRRIIETTPGRLIFNSVLPKGFEFQNITLGKKQVGRLFDQIFRGYGETVTAQVADRVKALGFKYSSCAGISIGIEDMRIPGEKAQLISTAKDEVNKINDQYGKGVITEQERYTKIIDLWTNTTEEVAKVMFDEIEADREGFNPIYIMADSGARGSKAQIKQLAGMRGLMADPFGKIRETPITSNFREGLSVIEFFQSTTGSRKGLTDTALKTANAGYLTRRLVDVAQDVVITEEDCGTTDGLFVKHIMTGEEISENVATRSLGRYTAEGVEDPAVAGEFLLGPGEYLDETAVKLLERRLVEELKIRSVLTCKSLKGVCKKCYGRDLGTGRKTEIGEAVGVIAAQSIGEPGTQLTLRTFHVGGTASADDTYIRARFSGEITALPHIKTQSDGSGLVIEESEFKGKRIEHIDADPKTAITYRNSRGSRSQQNTRHGLHALHVEICVKNKDAVKPDQDIVRVEVSVADACKIKTVKKDAVIVSITGKKERQVDIPAGLKVVVAEGEKIAGGQAIARRSFTSAFAGHVSISPRKEGGETIKLISSVEENITAISEKNQLVESLAQVGAEPKVKVGDHVDLNDIIGLNPSFRPLLAPVTGRIEFDRAALQKEGNEQIIIRPTDLEGTDNAFMVAWRGSEHVIGPDEKLLVDANASVEAGQKIATGGETPIIAHGRGHLHIVRDYHTRDGHRVLVVRVVESGDKQVLPYLLYSRPSASTSKSKAISKVKKMNIRLINKCHVVRFDLFKESEKIAQATRKMLEEIKATAQPASYRSDIFGTGEYLVPTQKALKDIYDFEKAQEKSRAAITVETGDLIVKQFSDLMRGPKEGGGEKTGMTKDITGGLPRVEELFEMRKPKSTPAIICPVDGKVVIGPKYRKDRTVVIKAVDGVEHEIKIPDDRVLSLENEQEVLAGDLMTDGPVDVQQLLDVKAEVHVQQYIVNEVQDVYRMQGVEINDKHIEVIVRQMMRKVQIEDSGDTEFLAGDLIDRLRLAEENKRVEALGKRAATYRPMLLGITKSAKHSDSFISAASFQETTWALTQAAILGKRDDLRGLKEAVIIGHLIPAGTGLKRYRETVALPVETGDSSDTGVGAELAAAAAGGTN